MIESSAIPIKDDRVPVAVGTCYQWYHKNKYPGLIIKVAGKLLFDLKKWDDMIHDARKNLKKESAHV